MFESKFMNVVSVNVWWPLWSNIQYISFCSIDLKMHFKSVIAGNLQSMEGS